MKRTLRLLGLTSLLLLYITGCSSPPSSQGSSPDYQTTKKMVIDMLKSDEGKKALQDVLSDPKFKKKLLLKQDFVKKTIVDTLTSEKGKKFWEELVADPEFSQKLAKAMESSNEKLLKQLMADPAYQGMMMKVFQAPKMEQQYLDLMQTKPFRALIQKEILETMKSPLFSTQITKALSDAVKQEMKKDSAKKTGAKAMDQ